MKGKPSPNKGKITSEEVRSKISESKKGGKAWNKGIKQEGATKERWAKVNIGRIPWNKGIPMTEEAKIKISESKKQANKASIAANINSTYTN
jgi:hypothetical protein